MAPLPSAVPAKLGQRVRSALAPDAKKMMLDADVPEAIRRWKRRGPLVVLIAGVAAFAILAIDVTATPYSTNAGLHIPLMLAMFAGVLLCKRAARRVVARAAAHDHLLCPDCTYDLRSLDATGTCPECGRAYEHAAVRAQWLDAQRRLTRK